MPRSPTSTTQTCVERWQVLIANTELFPYEESRRDPTTVWRRTSLISWPHWWGWLSVPSRQRELSWEGIITSNDSTPSSPMLTSSAQCNYHIRYKLQIFFPTFLSILCGPNSEWHITCLQYHNGQAWVNISHPAHYLLISHCYRLDISDGPLISHLSFSITKY